MAVTFLKHLHFAITFEQLHRLVHMAIHSCTVNNVFNIVHCMYLERVVPLKSTKLPKNFQKSVEIVTICNRLTRSVRAAIRKAAELGRAYDSRFDKVCFS